MDERKFVILTIGYTVGSMRLLHSAPVVLESQEELDTFVKQQKQYIQDHSGLNLDGTLCEVTFTNAVVRWWTLDEVANWLAVKDS